MKVNNSRHEVVVILVGLVLILFSGGSPARAQSRKNDCKQPPKIVFKPRMSDEDQRKWKSKSVSGTVAIVVSEEGDVTEAGVVAASPKQAAEALVNAVKQMKLKPRPGCGDLKTEVFFSLDR